MGMLYEYDEPGRSAWKVHNPDWPSGDGPHLVPADSEKEPHVAAPAQTPECVPEVPKPCIAATFDGLTGDWLAWEISEDSKTYRGASRVAAIGAVAVSMGLVRP